jgi:hypothetical protein
VTERHRPHPARRAARLALAGLAGLAGAAPLAAAPADAAACAAALGPGARAVAGEGVVLAWRPAPQPIPRDRHFAVQLRVCSPAPWAVTRVDADMPAHRHGMNYRATVQPLGDAQWRAEGLMFHMSGRWRLIVDLSQGERAQRLTDEVVLR